jgi:uncharacterized membrane protein
MMYGNNMSTGGWMLSIVGTLIILALIVAAVVWLASSLKSRAEGDTSASEILNRRLASGEITAEQYDVLRESLSPTAAGARRPGSPGAPG